MPIHRPPVRGRYRHASATRQRRSEWAQATADLVKKPCAALGCPDQAGAYGRFCHRHARYRSRQGAVDLLDVVTPDTLQFTVDHLLSCPDFTGRIFNDDTVARLNLATSGPAITAASPIQTPDPDRETFGPVARELSFETQAKFLWRHQRSRGNFPTTPQLLASCVASRWCYLLLKHAGVLGLRQSETFEDGEHARWTQGDHTTAYRTLFGKAIANGQTLYATQYPPAGVIRRLARDIEAEVFLSGKDEEVFPKSDAEFLEMMRPHEYRDRFVFNLIDRHQQSAGDR
jgi:hypothetical protein